MADAILAAGGVYQIINTVNGRRYIGSSVRLHKRLAEHRRKLDRGSHENARLQNAYKKYGSGAFEFLLIEHVSCRADLLRREQFWIDFHRSSDRNYGYNICVTAGSPAGTKHSDEAKLRMSAAQQKRAPASESTREKISAALKGRIKSPEEIERHRTSLTGYKHTEDARANMSASQLGRKKTVEEIEKTASAHRGMKRSAEARARMSEVAKRRGMPKNLADLHKSNTGRPCSDQRRELMRKAMKAVWAAKKSAQEAR